MNVEEKRFLTTKEKQEIINIVKVPKQDKHDEARIELQRHFRTNLLKQLDNVKLRPSAIPKYKQELQKIFLRSLISPGEMVGILCGQSIGEPCTQMSVDYETQVLVQFPNHGCIKAFKIGDFVEYLLSFALEDSLECFSMDYLRHFEDGDTTIMDVSATGLKVLAMDSSENVSWANLASIIKHPSNGSLVSVTLADGRNVVASKNFSFVTRKHNLIVPKMGLDLRIGDYLPVYVGNPVDLGSRDTNRDDASDRTEDHAEDHAEDHTEDGGSHCYIHLFDESLAPPSAVDNVVDIIDVHTKLLKMFKKSPLYAKGERFLQNLSPEDQSLLFYFLQCMGIDFELVHDSDGSSTSVSGVSGGGVSTSVSGVSVSASASGGGVSKVVLKNLKDRIIPNVYSSDGLLYPFMMLLDYLVFEDPHYQTNIKWEKITKIERVQSTNHYVYDFSVPGFDTFVVANGIVQKNTLNTFHSAGMTSKNMEMGIPRLLELVNTSKNLKTPTCVIYLKEKMTEQQMWNLCGEFVETRVSDLLLKDYLIDNQLTCEWWHILYSKLNCDYNTEVFMNAWGPRVWLMSQPTLVLHEKVFFKDICESPWVIRLQFNIQKLVENRISLDKVADIIERSWLNQVVCIPSPNHLGLMDIFVNCNDIVRERPQNMPFITDENVHKYFLRNIVLPNLYDLHVAGITGIKHIYVTEDTKKKEWYIETDGGNLSEVFTLSIVDGVRSYTNDIWQIYHLLGIEAMRSMLYKDYQQILGGDGHYSRHISLVCDYQTRMGKPIPVTSSGQGKMDEENNQQLKRATFEKAMEQLLDSARMGVSDNMSAVSNAIIIGKSPNIGTNFSKVICNIPDIYSSGGATTSAAGSGISSGASASANAGAAYASANASATRGASANVSAYAGASASASAAYASANASAYAGFNSPVYIPTDATEGGVAEGLVSPVYIPNDDVPTVGLVSPVYVPNDADRPESPVYIPTEN